MKRDQDPSDGSSSDYGEPGSSSDYGEPKRKMMKLDDSEPKQVDVPTEEKSEEEDSVKDESSDTSDEDEDSSTDTDDDCEENSPRDFFHMPSEFVINSQKINQTIRWQLVKNIQKFGRIYDRIFNLLDDVRGPLRVKKKFVNFAIEEAKMIHKRVLIKKLQVYLKRMSAYHQSK